MRVARWQDTATCIRPVNDGEDWQLHFERNLARGLPDFHPSLVAHGGTMIVVGSGPSLPNQLEDLRHEHTRHAPIVAVKGAHDLLYEHGIVPELFVSVEPRSRLDQVQHASPSTCYLLAPQTDPDLFDFLLERHCPVRLFYTLPCKATHPALDGKFYIPGGTTSGLRAIVLGWCLGFMRFLLYGFDSCIDPTRMVKRFTGEQPGRLVDRWIGGRRYLCTLALAMQADEFREYHTMLPGVSFDIRGEGLLAAFMEEYHRTVT